MARFVVRRLVSMVFVLFAVSVLTFLIFNVIPNGDPAVRMAGKQATESTIEAIREEWGFDEPPAAAVRHDDEEALHRRHGVATSRSCRSARRSSRGCRAPSRSRSERRSSGCSSASASGSTARSGRARFADRFLTVLALIGISMPVFWIGALMNHYLGFKLGWFPNGGYVEFTENPFDWFYHLILPWTALAILFIGVLLAGAALERARHDERGLRAHRAGQGALRAPDPDPARAAQLDDPDRHAVGARLRGRDRRRRDPHRDGLRPPGRRPVRGRRDRPARRAADPRGDACSARSSSSS